MTNDYTSLPEDLEPISAPAADSIEVRIGSEALVITPKAYAALGEPARVEILFGHVSRMLALRPVELGGRAVSKHGRTIRQVMCPKLIASLNLAHAPRGTTLRFDARLVDGALLIGPLPKTEAHS